MPGSGCWPPLPPPPPQCSTEAPAASTACTAWRPSHLVLLMKAQGSPCPGSPTVAHVGKSFRDRSECVPAGPQSGRLPIMRLWLHSSTFATSSGKPSETASAHRTLSSLREPCPHWKNVGSELKFVLDSVCQIAYSWEIVEPRHQRVGHGF